MSQYKLKEPPKNKYWEGEYKTPPSLFPDVIKLSELQIDKHLPALKFNQKKDLFRTENNKYNISVRVTGLKNSIDLYLFVNKEKRDMYYRIFPNTYTFRNVRIKSGLNRIEIFYRLGNRKSSSIYFNINGEGKRFKNEK